MSGTITHEWNGTVLTVTSDSGTSSADLKGEKGDTGIRGAQGVAGEQYKPQKGIDYFTEKEVEELAAAANEMLITTDIQNNFNFGNNNNGLSWTTDNGAEIQLRQEAETNTINVFVKPLGAEFVKAFSIDTNNVVKLYNYMDANQNVISNLAEPVANTDAATKEYVDNSAVSQEYIENYIRENTVSEAFVEEYVAANTINEAAVTGLISANAEPKIDVLPVEKGGTGATDAATALTNLGGISFRKLWENASPRSAFTAQTITIENANADFYLISAYFDLEASYYICHWIVKANSISLLSAHTEASTTWGSRRITITDNSFAFTNGVYGKGATGPTNSSVMIVPVAIYGIKGVIAE